MATTDTAPLARSRVARLSDTTVRDLLLVVLTFSSGAVDAIAPLIPMAGTALVVAIASIAFRGGSGSA